MNRENIIIDIYKQINIGFESVLLSAEKAGELASNYCKLENTLIKFTEMLEESEAKSKELRKEIWSLVTPMKPSDTKLMQLRKIHLIFVRPRGSTIWTMHMSNTGYPWRTNLPEKADKEVIKIANTSLYCARVVTIELPLLPDSKDVGNYSVLVDGDTIYARQAPIDQEIS